MKTGIIDWNDPKFNDPMEEIYAIRRLISEKNDHDIHKIFESVRQKDARAKALGMTYGEYCLAEVEGRLPLCAGEEPAEYKTGASLAAADLFANSEFPTRTVENRPGYNSWPMVQALGGGRIVCAYSRGKGHSTGEGSRGAFARVSDDGGASWGESVCVADSPEWGECVVGKGLDASGAMLLWVRRQGAGGWDTGTFHGLYRSSDGLVWERVASPSLDPEPIQITDVLRLPGGVLMSLWFAGNYCDDARNAWGTLMSRDNGSTWEQHTVERGMSKSEWPTEPSAVVLPDGRILAVTRTEICHAGQLQLLSNDGGASWTKHRTNITDVNASTPSLVFDPATGLLSCYYYERGPGLLKRRVAKAADIAANPIAWPVPEILAQGGKVRPHDSGNANATSSGGRHFVAWYSGDTVNAAVLVTSAPPPTP